jgi:hypothetical protein
MTPGGSASGWAVLLCCWGLLDTGALVWAGARLAAGLTGGHCEPSGITFMTDVAHGDTRAAWPGTPTATVVAATVVLTVIGAAAVVAIGCIVSRYRGAPGDPVAALGRNLRMRAMTRLPAARTAAGLRGSLARPIST